MDTISDVRLIVKVNSFFSAGAPGNACLDCNSSNTRTEQNNIHHHYNVNVYGGVVAVGNQPKAINVEREQESLGKLVDLHPKRIFVKRKIR